MAMKITDTDKGWKALRDRLKAAQGKPHVVVGVFGAKAAEPHVGSDKTVAEIAAVHEFGLTIQHPGGTAYLPPAMSEGARFISNAGAAEYEARNGGKLPRTKPHDIPIPERSFLRGTVDEKATEIKRMAKRLAGAVVDGKYTVPKALETLGLYIQGLIRSRMSAGIPPPLKAATIRRKGSSKPLIDKGQLRASIDFQVREK